MHVVDSNGNGGSVAAVGLEVAHYPRITGECLSVPRDLHLLHTRQPPGRLDVQL